MSQSLHKPSSVMGAKGRLFALLMLLVVPKTGWSALGRAGAQLRSLPLPVSRERHKSTEGIWHRDTKFKLNTG